MNRRWHGSLLVLALVVIFLLVYPFSSSAAWFSQGAGVPDGVPVSYPGAGNSLASADGTLDMCFASEPSTLYFYDAFDIVKNEILQTVYDGPVDTPSYLEQPTIIEQIPSLQNGLMFTDTVIVEAGDTVVDVDDTVISLYLGALIYPSGCTDLSCAIEYTGGQVAMDRWQIQVDLLPNLLWSDGEPLTAADMVYSFNLNAAPETPASKYQVERTASYTANGDTQVVWVGLPGFSSADSTSFIWNPLPEHAWGALTPAELVTAAISSRTPLGWGPYVIDAWVAGSHISMHKNPNYYRAAEGLPAFDVLVVHFGQDPVGGITSGSCDIYVSPAASVNSLQVYDDYGWLKVAKAAAGTVYEHLDFDLFPNPDYTGFAAQSTALQDVNVRHAIAHCLDRQEIADIANAGGAAIADSYIAINHPYYPSDLATYTFDPALGRALLAAAGWSDHNANGIVDKDGLEFSAHLTTRDNAMRRISGELIAQQLSANCGIEITVDYLGGEAFAGWPGGPLFGRNYDLGMFAWLTGVEPPCQLYTTAEIASDLNPSGQNNLGYSNPLFDAACESALAAEDEADKKSYHQAAARILAEDVPFVPLFSRIGYSAVAPHIFGHAPDPTESSLWNLETYTTGTEVAIPDSGLTFTIVEDATTFDFGTDVFSETVRLTYTPTSTYSLPLPEASTDIGHAFDATVVYSSTGEIAQVEPGQSYTLTIQYTAAEVKWAIEDTLALYYWDGDEWIQEISALDTANNTLTANLDHFSLWAVLGEPKKLIYLPLVLR